MDHFAYKNGRLHAEDVDLGALATGGRVGTPVYVYSKATLEMHYRKLAEAFAPLNPLICFSVKSCSNLSILNTLVNLGAGLDVVSGGELTRARLAGVSSDKIVYAGVGKTDLEIVSALGRPADDDPAPRQTDPIGLFNIESEAEFQTIASIAASLGVKARAALRVNPDVDPGSGTHKYTTTGKSETKFGVDLVRARQFFRTYDGHPNLKLSGLHIHLGSPIFSPEPYVQAIRRVLTLVDELERDGHRIDILNLGGGFGADYTTGQAIPAADYASAIVPELHARLEKHWAETGRRIKVILEPGRTIVANAGVLLTRVQYVKTSGAKKFLVCDAGMHTLLRPSLYEAFHFVWPTSVAPQHEPHKREKTPDLPGLETCDVVGPICETGDFLALDRPLPPVARGDLLAVFTTGAYGMTMASRYNSHPLPMEVMVDGRTATIIRQRESYADLVALERTPEQIVQS